MPSWVFGLRLICWILVQRAMNSWSYWEVLRDLTERIQLFWYSSLKTDLFFLVAILKRLGAKYFGAMFESQWSCQNFAFWPFPSNTTVATWNNCLSVSSQGTSVLTQGLELFFHSRHNHLSLRAWPNFLRLEILKPSNFFGRQTLSHLTKECPALAWSKPFQRNDRLIMSSFFLAHFANGKMVRW